MIITYFVSVLYKSFGFHLCFLFAGSSKIARGGCVSIWAVRHSRLTLSVRKLDYKLKKRKKWRKLNLGI
jgi:hypothetical protein